MEMCGITVNELRRHAHVDIVDVNCAINKSCDATLPPSLPPIVCDRQSKPFAAALLIQIEMFQVERSRPGL